MSQRDPDIITGGTLPGGTGMQAVEDSLKANASMNSGSAEPSYKVEGTPWYDTSTGEMKVWNGSAWVVVPFSSSVLDIGEIKMFGGSTNPSKWLTCDGAGYDTTIYADLFAVLAYTFGGAGSTFNVPDLQGRVPMGDGAGAGLTTRMIAQTGGFETHQLTEAELASHDHVGLVNTLGASPPQYQGAAGAYASRYNTGAQNTGSAGSDTAHNNVQPFSVVRFIIYAGV